MLITWWDQDFSLTHSFPMHPFSTSPPSENIRKPYGFLMFSGGRERVHWERMGLNRNDRNHNATTDPSPKCAMEL